MIDRPRFSPLFHVEIASPEGVFLLSERGHYVLKGELHCRLAQLLDGRRSADELVDLLAPHASAAQVYYALGQLEKKGYLVPGDAAEHPEQAALWHSLGVAPQTARAALAARTVAVRSLSSLPAAMLAEALAGLGLSVSPDEAGAADLLVVVVDDYLQPELAAINAEAQATGRPWMLVKPMGTVLWMGPIFRPGQTGCWSCLAQRLAGNREVESYLQRRKGSAEPFLVARAALPSTVQAALQLAATQIAVWLVRGANPEIEGQVLTLELPTMTSMRHVLTRRPQCPTCGDATLMANAGLQPVTLESRPKQFVNDGGHRNASPEQTVNRLGHHISLITGVISFLERMPADDERFLHVYMAGHNFAYTQMNLHFLRKGLRSKAAGKGMSDAQARASALCEAIERYSGRFQGDEPRVRASARELGDAAIHPNAVMGYSEMQYEQRQMWNARGSGFQVVPEPFDEEFPIEWTPYWSLSEQRHKYLPTVFSYYSYPHGPEEFFSWAESNGNAAGNTREEAILQGFFELTERDAVAIWWYNRVRRPAVDLDSFGEPYFAELQTRYARMSRELWVLDISNDLGIPTFAAVSRRTDKPAEDMQFAFGSHFDARIAVLRALTELNQFLPAVMHMPADGSGSYQFDDPESIHWWKTAKIKDHPYLAPHPHLPARRADDYERLWTDDVRDDVLKCQALVEQKGMELLVLDQTRPDIGLPVVKVVVPGLRHFWARFGPGRLYDVPVQLGWLAEPLREDQLNPIPIFI